MAKWLHGEGFRCEPSPLLSWQSYPYLHQWKCPEVRKCPSHAWHSHAFASQLHTRNILHRPWGVTDLWYFRQVLPSVGHLQSRRVSFISSLSVQWIVPSPANTSWLDLMIFKGFSKLNETDSMIITWISAGAPQHLNRNQCQHIDFCNSLIYRTAHELVVYFASIQNTSTSIY